MLHKSGFPSLCWRALPSRIPSTSPMGSCFAGGLEFEASQRWLSAGASTRFTQWAYQCPSHSGVLAARLVPCVCGDLPPRRESSMIGGANYTESCQGEAASLVIGCAVDPTIPCGLLYPSVRNAETLAIGNERQRYKSSPCHKRRVQEVCFKWISRRSSIGGICPGWE